MTAWQRLRALHARPGPLLSGGAWDAGSARLMAHLGYDALETSSAGLAFSTGRPDAAGLLTRDEILANAGAVAAAVAVPVSADLENGFGADPATVAETIGMAEALGIAGGSIEDATGDAAHPIYDFDHAVERIGAAVQAAGGRFVVTARCDAFMHTSGDLNEVVRRLRAFEAAGADVLAAPGLPDRSAIETVVRAVSKPVAVYAGLSQWQPTVADLTAIGVRKIGAGSGLARVALTALLAAAREIRETGDFRRVYEAEPFRDLNELFRSLNG